jgi:hypothetical protein
MDHPKCVAVTSVFPSVVELDVLARRIVFNAFELIGANFFAIRWIMQRKIN